MNLFLTALSLGFLGSFHCVGMCGPIALALPVNHRSPVGRFGGILLYNIGRITTYTLLGGFFGLVGQSFVIAGYQQIVSIALGVLILTMAVLPESVASRFRLTAFIYGRINILKQRLGLLFKRKNLSSLFFIGTLNGLLPCGLVYMGIAGAIVSGNNIDGALFMLMFGLGTMPAMFSVSLLSNVISLQVRNYMNKAVPLFVASMAILLILRGMNLGIPYISPELSADKPEAHHCCHRK